jgi:S1/P1 Nuclease
MFKDLGRVIPGILLPFLLVFPPQSWGWGNTGHEAVAYIAWRQLNPATRTRVIALLKKVPALSDEIPGYTEWVTQLPAGLSADQRHQFLFMRAATWADSIKHHGLHDSDTPPAGLTNEVHIGFGDEASHGYWHFIDTPFTNDSEQLPDTPRPNAVTQIAALRADIASEEGDVLKAYDMLWLEHLVGDIHQPLHASVRYVGGSGDRGGNLVKIKLPLPMEQKFKCPPSKSTPRELHAFWDDLPGSCPAETALKPAAAFASDLPLMLSNPDSGVKAAVSDDDPNHWANDSYKAAQVEAYADPIGGGLQPEDGTSGFLITQAYYDQAMADAKDRIALAGARLAKLLNENLK